MHRQREEGEYSLVKEVTTAPQHAAIMRWRCLLLPAFFFVILLPPAPADEDSGMLDDEEELEDEAEDGALVLAAISAGMLSVDMIKGLC